MIDELSGVAQFVRNIRNFLRETRATAEKAGPEHATATRRIVRTAWTVTAIGCVGVPCVAPMVAVLLLNITAGDALFRVLLGLLISSGTWLMYLPGGAALGCTLAPEWFLRGPAGQPWRRVFGERTSSAVFALFALGAMAGMALLLIYMAPTNVW